MSPEVSPWSWLPRVGVLAPSLLLILSLLILAIPRRRGSGGACTGGRRLPPSPPKFPLIGNLHQVGSCPHRFLAGLSRKHGPLMLLQLGQVSTLVVSSADTAEQIMKTHDAVFADRPQLEAVKQLSYQCVGVGFSPYGEYWRNLRKILSFHLLSTRKVQTHKRAREEEMALMIKKIERLSSASGVVDLTGVLQDFVFDLIWRVVDGRCFSIDDGLKRVFREAMERTHSLLSRFHVGDYFPSFRWLGRFTGFNSAGQKTFRKWDHVLGRLLENRAAPSGDDDEDRQENFVDVLLSFDPSAKFSLSTDVIKALIQDVFFAGTDTTYTALEWAMAELIRNPDVMKKAQAEVRWTAGAKPALEEDDITQMNYLRAVIKETLRLHPPATLLVPHLSSEDAQINGFEVPKQTRVLINAWAILRDPAHWEAPEQFRPERFLADDSLDFRGKDFQFIPFGAGRRICPGIQFAVSAAELALANLLHRFDWELPDGLRGEDLDMAETFGFTTHKKLRLHLVPIPRAL